MAEHLTFSLAAGPSGRAASKKAFTSFVCIRRAADRHHRASLAGPSDDAVQMATRFSRRPLALVISPSVILEAATRGPPLKGRRRPFSRTTGRAISAARGECVVGLARPSRRTARQGLPLTITRPAPFGRIVRETARPRGLPPASQGTFGSISR